MARRPVRPLSPEMQLQRDMLELSGYPAFRRFLFTVAQRSGIGGSTHGTDLDASAYEGRRSLGLEILRMVDEALPVRIAENAPFNALALAIAEVSALATAPMEEVEDAEISQEFDDDIERR